MVSDDEVAWCLDTVRLPALRSSAKPSDFDALRLGLKGKHEIEIDHATLGPTCGILPLGLASAQITTTGLEWDVGTSLTSNVSFVLRSPAATYEFSATCSAEDWETSFDTQISTSNHLVLGKDVTIETTGPVWWCCAITET